MNELQIFTNSKFGEIRTLDENGEVLFCGLDVARALGYSNPRDAVSRHCRWVVKRDVPHPQNPDKSIEMNFIPEGDLYRISAASELPAAKEFEHWIFDEVLPTLRKTGAYIVNSCPCPPQHTGEAARYIKVVAHYMEKQGSPAFEIMQMIAQVSAQHGIILPQNVVKLGLYQLALWE